MFPEGKNAIAWVRGGWHVAVAYVVGFFVMLAVLSWYPQPKHEAPMQAPKTSTQNTLNEKMAGRCTRPATPRLRSSHGGGKQHHA
jgi:hypothetical protein